MARRVTCVVVADAVASLVLIIILAGLLLAIEGCEDGVGCEGTSVSRCLLLRYDFVSE